MKAMLGTFRTAPTQALLYETQLIPVEQSLENRVLKSLTRIQTLPHDHPTSIWYKRALQMHRAGTTPYPSNLEALAKLAQRRDGTRLEDLPMETIKPYIRPPWWKSPVNIQIAQTREEAHEHHNRWQDRQDTLHIYTDGSGLDNHIGAAAYSPQLETVRRQYLGTDRTTTVYAGELTGIRMALELYSESEGYPSCDIYTDNQAAIRATAKPHRQSGQYIIAAILDIVDNLRVTRPDGQITVRWTPAHEGIEGNERADEEARTATEERDEEPALPHLTLKAARVMEIDRATAEKSGKAIRRQAPNPTQHQRIVQAKRCKTGVRLYKDLTWKETSVLARLRTGHCGLNGFLHRINRSDTANCECGYERETVKHFLIDCPTYADERRTMRTKVGSRNMRVERLLGDRKHVRHTLEYVARTRRFS